MCIYYSSFLCASILTVVVKELLGLYTKTFTDILLTMKISSKLIHCWDQLLKTSLPVKQ